MSEYIAVVVSARAAGEPNPDVRIMLGGMYMDVTVDITGWFKIRSEVVNVSRSGELVETDTVVLFARPTEKPTP